MANHQASERTLKMKQSFIKLHEQGLGIDEIATRFDLSPVTVYRCLDEIAAAARVTRESLLQRPHGPHLGYNRHDYQVFANVSLADHTKHIQETLTQFDQTLVAVDHYISTQEKIQSEEATKCSLSPNMT